MKLEHISAVLRPRSEAEAVDLGLAMVRRHAGGIYRAWFTLLIPLWGGLAAVFHNNPGMVVLIAWWLKTRNIKGRLIVLDPNLPALSFDRIFRDSYRDQITYLPQAVVKSLDPFKRRIVTDFDTIDFADGVVIGSDAHVSGHVVERGILKTASVRLGRNTLIGIGSVVGIGVESATDVQVGALSVVPKFSHLEASGVYVGVPVVRVR